MTPAAVDDDKLTTALRRELDKLPIAALIDRLGPPKQVTTYANGAGYWAQGDGAPAIRPEDPAEAQAIGRCVAARVQAKAGTRFTALHPRRCDWCDYPTDQLLIACDWAVWQSRFIDSEFLVWDFENGLYVRGSDRPGEYDNPTWQRFFRGVTPSTGDLPPSERAHLRAERALAIDIAAGYAPAGQAQP